MLNSWFPTRSALSSKRILMFPTLFCGAEVTIPGRLPVTGLLLNRTLRRPRSFRGEYALAELSDRFVANCQASCCIRGSTQNGSNSARRETSTTRHGLSEETQLVVGRDVPRKVSTRSSKCACWRESPHLRVLIAGSGRDSKRLQKIIDTTHAPGGLLGRVSDDDNEAAWSG